MVFNTTFNTISVISKTNLYIFSRNQAEVMDILMRKGAQINSLNNGGCSSLHVAVNKQHLECAKILLRYKCQI
jgi:ankyrin repeat protein